MVIKYNTQRSRFEASWAYSEFSVAKETVKTAGFRFDAQNKVWFAPLEVAARLTQYFDESAKRFLNPEVVAAAKASSPEAAVAASRATDAEVEIPRPTGLNYLPYQKAGIAYAMARKNVLIADEMGLGKTVQGIGISNNDPTIRSILIVCPASLKLNWAREFVKWDTKQLTIGIVTTKKPTKKALARLATWSKGLVSYAVNELPATDVVIINYDILGRKEFQLRGREWHLQLVDECHKLKNHMALRTRNLLGKRTFDKTTRKWVNETEPIKASRRAFLTGTPICNRPVELWPLLMALDPTGLGAYKGKFEEKYCGGHFEDVIVAGGHGETRRVWNANGATNLSELQQRLRSSFMVRRLKEDVLKELPAKIRQVIVLESEGLEDLIEREKAAFEAAQLTSVDIDLATVSLIRKQVALAKVPQVIEQIETILEEKDKVVVMAHHHEVVDALADHFGSAAVRLDGRVTDLNKRDAAVERFQNDASCKVFVGSIQAAGVGLTLTAASVVVFAELDWVPGNVTQAEDRCHRIGQTDTVLIYHLVLDGSVDANMVEKIIAKQAIISAALDKQTAPVMPEVSDPTARKPADPADLTPEQIAAIQTGLKMLAAACDGARELDGMGFNKRDTEFGKSLAAAPRLSQKQARFGQKMIRLYHRQLPVELVRQAGV